MADTFCYGVRRTDLKDNPLERRFLGQGIEYLCTAFVSTVVWVGLPVMIYHPLPVGLGHVELWKRG